MTPRPARLRHLPWLWAILRAATRAAPALPPPVPFVVVPGDATFDNQRAILWFTNGLNLGAIDL